MPTEYNELDEAWEWRDDQGNLHRENGPAIKFDNGDEEWYYQGLPHREDGPALIYHYAPDNGSHKEWFNHGELHREDGPAVEYSDGKVEYWLHGKEVDASAISSKISKPLSKQEKPCQVCNRMNDLGKTQCWWCLNVPF